MAKIVQPSAGKGAPVNGTNDDDVIKMTPAPGVAQSDPLNFDLIYAMAGNDNVRSGVGHDEVYGGEGNDQLRGGGGKDHLFGDEGNDKVIGQKGNDRLYGGDGNDRVSGGDGNDRMFGGAGNDKMVGGEGSDIIRGGDGDDLLYGDRAGDGDDQQSIVDYFVFDTDDGFDRCFDFEEGIDKIILEGGGPAPIFTYNATANNTVMEYGGTTVRFYDAMVTAADVFPGGVEDIVF